MRKWFREIRERKGLSQKQFAEILDVSQQLIGKIENGGNIRVSTAKKLGDKMRIKWSLFFEDYDKQLEYQYQSEVKDDIEFLKKLQEEIVNQSHDGQAAPRFWAIGDYEDRVTDSGYEDDVCIYDPHETESYSEKEVLSMLRDIRDGKEEAPNADNPGIEYLEEKLEEIEGFKCFGIDIDDLADLYREFIGQDPQIVYTVNEHIVKPNTMFITKQEAKDHLEANHYHYTEEAHTYAMTAWRAPKVERLWNILENFDWDKVEVKK
jgi:transcriptional regulator with XRE-family HTH domain